MSRELAKTYNPKEIEEKLYERWCENKYFHAEADRSRKPFTTVMPPPNITGKLHMGHALDNTLQDILIRYKRMEGYNALWIPGTDHAAISTEVKVTNQLKEEGIDKKELGREGFLERTWQWKEEYAGTIENQLKKLGISCDWDRERFTMDEGCSKAVEEVFISLYEKGYIYKGSRIINWCPKCKTSLSDAEVEHEEQEGHFWHIKYPIVGTERFLEIATTRPETMLGDTAIAVHPDDERYKDIVGKKVLLPLVNKEIPIVADYYVDKEFGTGAVKITPAHDPNDFEVGKRHGLEEINIMNDDATINEKGGKYAGMERYEARKAIVKDLKEQGYLVKIEPHSHNVGTHDRCGTTVEPLIKQQWFVKMDELAKPAIDALKNGELKFVPERFDKIYLHWLENIKDWCISRQIWWGHRIPAYYCDDCGEFVVAREMPEKCPHCGCTHFTQDEDTLDTWFSSALWPFSTLGWPDKTEDLDYFYPTDVLVTGYDIIFFWVIRMVFSGYAHTGKSPFHTVLIHGLVRDSQGRKMSKSLGNGIDPLEIIDQYGADALRLTLVTGNAPGNDMRFYTERVEASRNFANKVWNASRFILMNIENENLKKPEESALTLADKWILSSVNTLAKDVTENMDKFELGIAVQKVYDFIWDEFCDWYIEMAKFRIYHKEEDPEAANAALWTLKTVLGQALKMLHPFMPFVTEEIYEALVPEEESLMMSSWPVYTEERVYREAERVVGHMKEIVRGIRNIRAEMNVENSRKTKVYIVTEDAKLQEGFGSLTDAVKPLMNAAEIFIAGEKPALSDDAVSVVVPDAVTHLPLEDLVDFEQERERLEKEEEKLKKEIKRAQGMLSNEKFVNKAPQAKVEEERKKLEKYTQMLTQVQERMAGLKK
ncbi:valine--tRNA ligase [Faecalicatena acetigenes]|uniref:Valine--tRNA ligase n=1 Tax=Faecalicatena acetigenes TaxID=2981790 RepID=A0ABT2T7N3_9FIRM|nr:valine--tRNA ligase [Faecalicatena acetigenes]MCU6746284.1 valine--tRNA ligase [Faecalicatena acetigenes]SCH05422.1 Valine--tRNA ligase [uncultured Clostridium sp.]